MTIEVQVHCLTNYASGIARVITTPIQVTNTVTGATEKTNAIWDTGATNSAITNSLAQKLGLLPINKAVVTGVHGAREVNVFAVQVILNNNQITFTTPVTECDELSGDQSSCFLIGMDIITKGDFIISNVGGQTVMTFRIPSIHRFDFVAEANADNAQKAVENRKLERNALYKMPFKKKKNK